MTATPVNMSDVKYPISLWTELNLENWKDKDDAANFFKHLHEDIELTKFEVEKETNQADDHWDLNVSIKTESALFSFIHWLWPQTRSIEAELDNEELWICPIDKEGWHVVEMNCI